MKRSMMFFLVFICYAVCGQDLKEDDFRANGNNFEGLVKCQATKIFTVNVSPKIQNNEYCVITLEPKIDQIIGFEISDSPSTQLTVVDGSKGKRLVWSPLNEKFGPNEMKILKVKLLIDPDIGDEDKIQISCDEFIIELPIKRDQAPKFEKDNFVCQILIDGPQKIEKSFNVVKSPTRPNSGGNYQNLDIFTNDDTKPIKVSIMSGGGGIFSIDNVNGLLLFKRQGILVDKEEISLTLEVEDHLGSKVQGVVKFALIPNKSAEPIWTIRDANGNRIENKVYSEGEEIILNSFEAKVPVNSEICKISQTTLNGEVFELENSKLVWTPSFDLVDDSKGSTPQEIEINFVATSEEGITSNCKLKIKIENSASPETIKIKERAILNFEESQQKFYENVSRAMCLLHNASELVKTDGATMNTINNTYSNLENTALGLTSASPYVFAVWETIGVVSQSLGDAKEKKAKRIAERADALKNEINLFYNSTVSFINEIENLDDFYTEAQAEELFKMSSSVRTAADSFKLNESFYTSIIQVFASKKKKNELRIECPRIEANFKAKFL